MTAEFVPWLALAIFVVAVLYSSVGHAGASGYIAAMSLLSLAPEVIKPTALALNILVASPDAKPGRELVWINAAVTHRKGNHTSPEGCLSVPGISSPVERATEITMTGKDRQGRIQTLKAEGLLAKILQHEVDHLQGHLYLDRLKPGEKEPLLQKYRKLSETLRKIDL